jgi:surface-anchored protein
MPIHQLPSFRPRPLARPLVVLVTCALAGFAGSRAQAGTWTLGHGDIGVAYSGTGTAFEMEVHLGEGAVISGSTVPEPGEAFEPGDVVIQVPNSANLKAISTGSGQWAGNDVGYDFVATGTTLGVAQGGNLWVLSFNESDADFYQTPFLGWATEEGFDGLDFGNVTFTPYSFSSPAGGSMGIFEDDLTPLWVLLDGDSSFSGDSFEVAPGGHVHRVLAFTQPGIYEIGIQATSLLDGTTVVGQSVYTFEVVPEPSSVVLAGLGAMGALAAGWRRRRLALAGNSAFAEAAR